jgi:hypothetical protein
VDISESSYPRFIIGGAMKKGRWQLKDIPDEVILKRQLMYWETKERPFTYEAFKPLWPEKLVFRKMGKLCDQGYLEYGVSLRTAWLTDKAIALLKSKGMIL